MARYYLAAFVLDDFTYSKPGSGNNTVPVPGAVWLVGCGLVGLVRLHRNGR